MNLVTLASSSQPSTSERASKPKISKYTNFLLPHGSPYINNKLLVGVEPVQHMFTREPEHGIFYLDSQNHICFQHTADLPADPTKHQFNLRLEGLCHKELEHGYHVLISLELSKRLADLQFDKFKWAKPEILTETEIFSNGDFEDSLED